MKIKMITALWLIMLVNYLDRVAISFAGPAMMKSLSMSPSSFGLLMSSFGVGYLLAQIPGGVIADRRGVKIVLIVGPLFWALFTGLTGLVAGLSAFLAVRVLFGISEGLSATAIQKCVGDNFVARERARVLAINSTATALAPAIAGAFVVWLIAAHGWRAMFLLMVIPALAVSASSYFLLPSKPSIAVGRANRRPGEQSLSLKRMSFWLVSLGFLGFNIGFWGYVGWMPSYLAMAHNLDLKAMGSLGSIPYAIGFVGLLLGGWLGSGILQDRRPQLVAAGMVAAAISLLLTFFAGSLILCVVGLSATAFFLYGCTASIGALIIDLSPDHARATYVGLVSVIGQLGPIIAPSAVGILVSRTGSFAGGFGVMIVALGIAAGCMLALGRDRRSQAATLQAGNDWQDLAAEPGA